jgi:hypothetical protein
MEIQWRSKEVSVWIVCSTRNVPVSNVPVCCLWPQGTPNDTLEVRNNSLVNQPCCCVEDTGLPHKLPVPSLVSLVVHFLLFFFSGGR